MKHNVFGLFGAVAVLLTVTAALTLSRVTPSLSVSGIGDLKCYDIKGQIEKCSGTDRSHLSVHHARLD